MDVDAKEAAWKLMEPVLCNWERPPDELPGLERELNGDSSTDAETLQDFPADANTGVRLHSS